MAGVSLFSDSWYRVSSLKPRLRKHIDIHRRHIRGKRWYVLQDHVTGKFHRFSPDAYFIIQLMDGSKTVNDIWLLASKQLDDEHLPTQDDIIQLLSRLHNADVILGGAKPDSDEMVDRQQTLRKKKIRGYFINPLGLVYLIQFVIVPGYQSLTP
jgi:putative peptide zinc metalloprotease protein